MHDVGLAEGAAQHVEFVHQVVEQHPPVAEAGVVVALGQRGQ